MHLETRLSMFLVIHVLERSATVKCQETLESTYLWYNSNLFLGWSGRLSIAYMSDENMETSLI